jgi:hypothetical protein
MVAKEREGVRASWPGHVGEGKKREKEREG